MSFSGRIVSDFSSILPDEWDQLDHAGNPFLSHAFLAGLETSGCIGPGVGWVPNHLALYDGDRLVAFAPSYVKTNSHGEFVFDWAWADAFQRHGLPYYPKLLTAVPYSPVTGPRLLTATDHPSRIDLARLLTEFARQQCDRAGLSSWHCNFILDDEKEFFKNTDMLARSDWQFHWHNQGYRSFDDFLLRLRSRKRKNIRRERRQVQQAGIRFNWKSGNEITADDAHFIHRCYASTFHAYGNHPVLNESFFRALASGLKKGFQVCIASRDEAPLAMSLFLCGGGRLYGRYWGCLEDIPALHFESAYYQGIEYAIRNGISVFESGAQGEHKVARGFMPEKTRSFHFIRHEAFRDAIGTFLQREQQWLEEYRDELLTHSPYRQENS
ncbi:GNAT family N-acetyltransferase [Pseudomonadota bacterium]